MNIRLRKLQLLQVVMLVDDEPTLNGLEELLRSRRVSAYEREMTPMFVEELRERVRQSEKDFGSGRVVDAKELLESFK